MASVIEEIVASGIQRDEVIKTMEKYELRIEGGHLDIGTVEKNIWEYKLIFTILLEDDIKNLAVDLRELPIETFRLFTRFISSSKNLFTFRIGFSKRTSFLSDEEAQLLRDSFAKNNSIERIMLWKFNRISIHQYVDALPSNTKINAMTLFKLRMDKDTSLSLKEYISNTTKLLEVHISDCHFNEESLAILSDAFRNNRSLLAIEITSESAPYVSDVILEATCQSDLLYQLKLQRIPKNINSYLVRNKSVTDLAIWNYESMNMDDINILVEGLKRNETLINLEIQPKSGCASRLSEAWTNDSKIRLREINLSANEIIIDDFKVLMTAWKNAPRLSLRSICVKKIFDPNYYSVNGPFIEQFLKECQMIENFDCSFQIVEGDLHTQSELDQICGDNKRRKIIMVKILIMAQTLFYSDFISLITEESLILDILYFVQDSYDVDNNPLLNRVQIGRVWQYAKKKPLRLEYNSKDLFIEYVLYGPDNKTP